MFGLPSDVDLHFLVGTTLLQVCFGANEVILNFDRAVSITIESRFSVRVGGEDHSFDDPRASAACVLSLVSAPVTAAAGQPDGTLRLMFSGDEIMIFDSNREHESYQIHHGKEIIVV